MLRKRALLGLLIAVTVATGAILASGIAGAAPPPPHGPTGPPGPPKPGTGPAKTATPIKHVVVIFQENVSFDHYYGTYPNASGGDGQPFSARPGTPAVAGLTPATGASLPASLRHSTDLTTAAANPNLDPPLRLDSSADGLPGDAGGLETCDQDHNYSDEQQSMNGGLMNQFVQSVGAAGTGRTPNGAAFCQPSQVMDYYDGNSTTALWNYAQHYSMSDNSFGTTFGPSAPGAINLAAGDTGNVDTAHEAGSVTVATATAPNADVTPDGHGGFSLTSDAQPYWDDCSTRDAVALTGTNIGDELNKAGLSWGWFQGGFRPTTAFAAAAAATGHTGQATATFIPDEFSGNFTGKVVPPASTTGLAAGLGTTANQALCDAFHPIGVALGASGTTAATAPWGFKDDYIAHHEPFEYYSSTANPHHLVVATDPSGNDVLHGADSLSSVGTDTQSFTGAYGAGPQFDTPNHNYDTSDFDQLVGAINDGKLPAAALPAVTFLKAPGYQDGHAQYSNPRDEQTFVVNEINALQASPDWSSTVVFVNYDDSDGWYDHVYSGVTNPSLAGADNLTNTKLGKINATNPTSGQCGPTPHTATSTPLAGQEGRCGFGPRLPMLAISPCASSNTVDHNLSNQASIINFIEYNWNLPAIPGSFDQAQKATDTAEGVPFDLAGMFDFADCSNAALPLSPVTGQIDLAGADMRNRDSQGADFANGNLANSNFNNANLQGAFLPGADLSAANLRNIDGEGADLAGANLNGVALRDAKLQGATLAGANLTNGDLTNARLDGANIQHAIWSNTICPDHTNSDHDGGTCAGHLGH
ncbi:MAG TPA: alkaline phosphatase family protein [Gaiellaceae bacterium]